MAAEAKESESKDSIDAFEEDDDDVQFSIIPGKNLGSHISMGKGLNLDLSLASIDTSSKPSAEDRIEQRANTAVHVLFDLPDGSQVEHDFQLGQTVEVLKSFLSIECGIPMGSQQLFLESGVGPLLDPMSLSDYPQISTEEEVVIRVDGDMDRGAKK
mmetsp:Transcript_5661/g.7036  ORF Transcript_5661/g.7036 Transcript_5661/m.7036 type:complete len:157 (+) Transcript_5661:53-523(+)|eukprot:CAMPEP_0114351380 /NCGR_PEP_ID=MMETSP0101-20121206/17142_1 /TAXON_ID=38822 ORGANISM="Pteridomonas danica, Strain PT" /NCGR_SAMPLE_ID=MMETSP0101 /ASSEMBLY_ACC=CAM_ASM_000211 /LENGTH=156 /DNA_ID=CAMNT_0001491231 /DNA_START=47 /DNA_END=517 /DNA_ORIENTATION=-